MYLPILRMSCHALGLLLATVLCWNLCQGEIKFYSDNAMCSKNGTTKSASTEQTVSVIFCVKLGPRDVLHAFVDISDSPTPPPKGNWYLLNGTDNKPLRVSSLTKTSYTTVNITFTKLKTRDFNKKFYVSIFKEPLEENVKVWFILKQETEQTPTPHTATISTTVGRTLTHTAGTTPPPSDQSSVLSSQETMNYIYISIAVVTVLIIAVITIVLIYHYKGRLLKMSRPSKDAEDLNAYAEIRDAMISSNRKGQMKVDKPAEKEHRCDEKIVTGDNKQESLETTDIDDKDTGRNISEQGLVYVTVAQATKQDKKKSEQASDKKKKPQETKQEPVVESVEYTTVDLGKSGKFMSTD